MKDMTVDKIAQAMGGSLLCKGKDCPVCHISIDSRKISEQTMFVPLIGEKVDAHCFLKQVIESGAVAVCTSEHTEPEDPSVAWILVDDTKKALQRLGCAYRDSLSIPVVGITGSVGKTTTREMIAMALSAGKKVYKTPGNSNSQVGVPLTLSEISDEEIAVIELGMSEPGELSVIAKIAKPDMAVITNIGITHIEQLGSRENIYHEKLTIQDGMKSGGILFLNADDDLLVHTKARDGIRTIYYGRAEQADYRAENIRLENGYPVFLAVHGEEKTEVRLQIMGEHNVGNAMAALAVARENGIPMQEAAKALEAFDGFQNRQKVYQVNGITILDDTYNASPVSMQAAISVLSSMEAKRKIAVLADMKELGERSLEYHYEIGRFAAEQNIDFVVTCGEMAKQIAKGVLDAEKSIQVVSFMDNKDIMAFLDGLLKEGDSILLKGSNSMRLFEVSKHLIHKGEEEKD